ncbi:MAG: hypothetical protein VX079_04400, partial [Pseudomonadota bacterium]|nr:hypothetical protein [Pseudomonadota bacterium]
ISLPGVPRKLSDFTVKARGLVTPQIKNDEWLDEKKRGKRARNFAVKIVSRDQKISFVSRSGPARVANSLLKC